MAPRLCGEVLCVACYNEQPAKDHVDFQAEVDRGWYAEGTDNPVPLDELIICEDCVKAAAQLLDMEDATQRGDEITRLRAENDQLRRDAGRAQELADRLEEARLVGTVDINYRRQSRKVSDEQRREASERMKRLHAEGKMGRKPKEPANA